MNTANTQPAFFHTVIIGAGAAGMMAAARIGQRGRSVALLDHALKIGEKIRISGGGRCNFTNRNLNGHDASPYYVSQQPRFVRHALAQFSAADFVALVEAHGIAYHEKHKGQLFCTDSAKDIIAMLQTECARGGVVWHTACEVRAVNACGNRPSENNCSEHQEKSSENAANSTQNAETAARFELHTTHGLFRCQNLIIATGGLAAPAVGATAFGYEIARQFGHSIVPPEAALVPLRFEHWAERGFDTLSGIALPVRISTGAGKAAMAFDEDLLFRHKGLSGPAILQISSYWRSGQTITVNLVPDTDLAAALCSGKNSQKIQLNTALKQLCPALPERLLDFWLAQAEFAPFAAQKWADTPNAVLQRLGQSLNAWTLLPSGSDGHKKAEATRGGVNVKELDPKTMQSRLHTGLYFIGEVTDITGWLGGYNFQWAWSSAVCAAAAVCAQE